MDEGDDDRRGETEVRNNMKIVVGSTNPVKVEAVRKVFEEYFEKVEVEGREVKSGVAEQPISELETMQGARMRAYAALEEDPAAMYGVGLEGGVTELDPTNPSWMGVKRHGRLFECAWVGIVRRDRVEGMGGGLYFELPPKIAKRIRAGEELGPIMAELLKYDVKRNEGAIGVLSKGKLSRRGAYEHLVKQALLKFVSPEWWENS